MKRRELVLRNFKGYNDINEYLEKLESKITNVSLNWRMMKCEVREKINIDTKAKRDYLSELRIPMELGFIIKEAIDDEFDTIDKLFVLENGFWKCNMDLLSESEQYLIILEGNVSQDFMNNLVRVQPALNRDQTEDLDRYWLDAMIKDVEIWDDIWKTLNVNDVDIYVNVSLDRCFSALIPEDIKKTVETTQEFLKAGRSRDRARLFKAWWAYRKIIGKQVIAGEDLVNIGRQLLEPESFTNYIDVDDPYRIGNVQRTAQSLRRTLPESISVTAKTELNYDLPIATGYLNFHKKVFIDVIREELEKISD